MVQNIYLEKNKLYSLHFKDLLILYFPQNLCKSSEVQKFKRRENR